MTMGRPQKLRRADLVAEVERLRVELTVCANLAEEWAEKPAPDVSLRVIAGRLREVIKAGAVKP